MSIHRLYVDEVGNSDYKSSRDPNNRYLSLTGLMLEVGYVANTFGPALEALKVQHCGSHPDAPIILHRRELLDGAPPFELLRNPDRRRAFDSDLLTLIRAADFMVLTVVIDKLAMLEKYKVWQHDPYHYAMEVLLERFVGQLLDASSTGNVMAEARGKKEDKRLKEAYQRIYRNGSSVRPANDFRAALTSGEMRFKTKEQNVPGLQLADLIAYPSYRVMRAVHNGVATPDRLQRDDSSGDTWEVPFFTVGKDAGMGSEVAALIPHCIEPLHAFNRFNVPEIVRNVVLVHAREVIPTAPQDATTDPMPAIQSMWRTLRVRW